jgi:class 3 adenylate cyclase
MLQPEPVCLLIADISGYTRYLASVELDHAHDILADLIGTVVTALRPTFRLAKLEGDAAFVFAPAEKLDATLLLDTVERCYFGFRRRRRDVRQATSCPCNACSRIPDLNLKFVVHHGPAMRQKMAGREELLGSDVIVVHRLLKNEVTERLGFGAYALFTQASVDAVALEPAALGMQPLAETYEFVGEVGTWVLDLERRWQEEEARRRVFVTPEQAWFTQSVATVAPPQLAWEFVTSPGRRPSWQVGVTEVALIGAAGNRRAVGATNHCRHGTEGGVLEEILDWRPYDYLSDRGTHDTPSGPARMIETIELEPTATGTTVHFRYSPPTNRKERAAVEALLPFYRAAFATRLALLAEQLAVETAARDAERAAEPDVPAPSADGPLAGLGAATR